jgi:hypothetical protein
MKVRDPGNRMSTLRAASPTSRRCGPRSTGPPCEPLAGSAKRYVAAEATAGVPVWNDMWASATELKIGNDRTKPVASSSFNTSGGGATRATHPSAKTPADGASPRPRPGHGTGPDP